MDAESRQDHGADAAKAAGVDIESIEAWEIGN